MNRKGSGILSVFFKYLKYRFRSRHKKGRGIHSPFVFDLTSKVIYNGDEMDIPDQVRNFHKNMLRCRTEINIVDHGAGSRVTTSARRKISSIAKSSSLTRKYAEILFRLSAWYVPGTIIELGTGIGISTAYLGAGCREATVYSVEGSKEKTDFAKIQFQESDLGQVNFIYSKFEDCFGDLLTKTSDHSMIFIDGDHRYEPTVQAVKQVLHSEELKEVIIILDDIHWSDEMEKAWNELCEDPRIDISVNLFFMGFLIRRPGIRKQHFNISL